MRDHNVECQDNHLRKYAYDFDYVLRDYMIKTFKPFWRKEMNALEMGCYHGELTQQFDAFFSKMTVIEASDELIDIAKNRVSKTVRFLHSTFEAIDLQEKYDAIFLIHTLEHLDDPVLVLKKVNQWLTEDGLLFLVVPNANAISRQLAVRMGLITHNHAVTEGEYLHGHRMTYNFDLLERDVKQSGLKIQNKGGIFLKPFANFQFDLLLQSKIINQDYLDACYELGMIYPDLSASIYLICKKG